MKKCFAILFVFLIFILSSCDTTVNEQINQMISNIPALFEQSTIQNSAGDTGFLKILKSYTEKDKSYFSAAEREMSNAPLNQKYSYGVSAYHQSNGICDTATMFFGENSAEELNLYFRIYGFNYKEYSADGNKAVFKCEKDGAVYRYEVSYGEDPKYFEILNYKNDTVVEALKCNIDDNSIFKVYYDGNIKQLIVSSADSANNVVISWYGTEFIENFGIPAADASGSVQYIDGVLSYK